MAAVPPTAITCKRRRRAETVACGLGFTPRSTAGAVTLPQRLEQIIQPVVVDLVHQRQQAADFALGKAGAGEPGEVVAGQIGDDATLVLAKWHGACDEQL